MSIGRIELIDGKKQYVRYATLGGGVKLPPSYDSVLANNTWAQIDQASREGKAKELWNLGDEKDGFVICGFDHDDLADGTGKAGISFVCGLNKQISYYWTTDDITGTNYWSYQYSDAKTICEYIYEMKKFGDLNTNNLIDSTLKNIIKKVIKKCRINKAASFSTVEDTEQYIYLLAAVEVGNKDEETPMGNFFLKEGEKYEYVPNYSGENWSRTTGASKSGGKITAMAIGEWEWFQASPVDGMKNFIYGFGI